MFIQNRQSRNHKGAQTSPMPVPVRSQTALAETLYRAMKKR